MKLMKLKFSGTYAELQDEVMLTGIAGEWRDLGNHKQFRADTGAVLNWWQSTGTISFQGPGLAAEEFEAKLFCVQPAPTKLRRKGAAVILALRLRRRALIGAAP